MIYWGSEADRLNGTESASTLGSCGLGSTIGGPPKSIRKRGFNRALRRGILWAICSYAKFDYVSFVMNFAKVFPDHNCPNDNIFVVWPKD